MFNTYIIYNYFIYFISFGNNLHLIIRMLGYAPALQHQATPPPTHSANAVITACAPVVQQASYLSSLGSSSFTTPTMAVSSSNTHSIQEESLTDKGCIEESGIHAAWALLSRDENWLSCEKKNDWLIRLGARDAESLEYLEDEEIEELKTLLTTIPYRRFKKFMGK